MAWESWKKSEVLIADGYYRAVGLVKAEIDKEKFAIVKVNIHLLKDAVEFLRGLILACNKIDLPDDPEIYIYVNKEKTEPVLMTNDYLENSDLYVAIAPMMENELEEEVNENAD